MATAVVNEPKKSSKKKRSMAVAGVLAGCLALGGTLAYLTDTDSVTNRFTVDTDLDIQLVEPTWTALPDADDNGIPDAAENMAPTQTVDKDPIVENIGTVDAWIAAKVKVPVFTGEMLNDEGKVVSVTDQDLFTYEVNEGWTQVGEATVEDGYRVYTYVYANMLAGATGEGETAVIAKTASIFDEVTLANLTHDIGVTDTQIDVDAYAIQALGFDDAETAYTAYQNQQATGVSADEGETTD